MKPVSPLARVRDTDAAIPYLTQLHGLQRLDIQGTDITQTDLAQLKAALPDTRIVYP